MSTSKPNSASDGAGRAAELMAEMLKKRFFVAWRKPRNLTRASELLSAHLEWMVAAEARGEIVMSGPFLLEGAAPGASGGMTVLRASGLAEAERRLQDDPFISNGIYAVEVFEWMVMEGSMTFNVRFSNTSINLL